MHTTSTRTRLSRDERAEQLLDVAEEQFARYGYAETTIDLIAREAGITRPIVYEHFGSKDGIYLAVVRRARGRLDAALVAAVAETDDFEERLARGAGAMFTFMEQNPNWWAVLFNGAAVTGAAADEFMDMRFATVEGIADLLQQASPATPREEAEAVAHALSGAAEQLERWWRRNPTVPRESIVGYFHRFAWSGLRSYEAGA